MQASAISTFMGMFSPTRSPFYAVVVAGLAALGYLYSSSGASEWETLRFAAYPIMPLIFGFSVAAFLHKLVFTPESHDYQLVYARTIGLISAIVALSIIVVQRENLSSEINCEAPIIGMVSDTICQRVTSFGFLYRQALFAGLLFLTLSVVRSQERPRRSVVNYTQIALILSALLGSGTLFATLASDPSGDLNTPLLFALFALGTWWLIMPLAMLFLSASTRFGVTNLTTAHEID